VAHGKICYVEIPAKNVSKSAEFYANLFGWKIRSRGDGQTAFDDATGAVSGTWVREEDLDGETSMVTYIMVDNIDETQKKLVAAGGKLITPRTPVGPGGGAFAIFNDPAGNRVGLYEDAQK